MRVRVTYAVGIADVNFHVPPYQTLEASQRYLTSCQNNIMRLPPHTKSDFETTCWNASAAVSGFEAMPAAIFMQPAKAPAARSLTAFLSGDEPVGAIRRLVSRPIQWTGAIGPYGNNRVQSSLWSKWLSWFEWTWHKPTCFGGPRIRKITTYLVEHTYHVK